VEWIVSLPKSELQSENHRNRHGAGMNYRIAEKKLRKRRYLSRRKCEEKVLQGTECGCRKVKKSEN
jgi:hypothetical protein